MTYSLASMLSMGCPTKGLGVAIGNIDSCTNMFQEHMSKLVPLLDGKILNIDMTSTSTSTSTRIGMVFVVDGHGGHVVLI